MNSLVRHFYNEINPYRAAVLRERMEDGFLPKGTVDERNIEIIPDEDLLGYTQIHLFAGIGGFPLGLRQAGFSESIRLVTGGFPCQDISNAGKRAGITGSRSRLWREMVRCIRVVRPEYVFVENVAALLNRGMGVVLGDLAEVGYDATGDCISAADVGAPHLRRRIWIIAYPTRDLRRASRNDGPKTFDWCGSFMADAEDFSGELRSTARERQGGFTGGGKDVANTTSARCNGRSWQEQSIYGRPLLPSRSSGCGQVGDADKTRSSFTRQAPESSKIIAAADSTSWWESEPDVGRVAHGIPKRVDRLAALGDAIVPQCVEEVIRRFFS